MTFQKFSRVLILLTVLTLTLAITGKVSAQPKAEVGFFEEVKVRPGVQFEVPVKVRSVNNLFAIDIEIKFDPTLLQVEDSAPSIEGIQVGLGEFLDAGLMLYNEADNQKGIIRFAMSQVNPSEPKSGDGVIIIIEFLAVAEGEAKLEISMLEGSTNLGEAIALDKKEGKVTISEGAPDIIATPIPTQDIEGVIPVPTLSPEEYPTAIPTEEKPEVEQIEPETPVELPGEENEISTPISEGQDQEEVQDAKQEEKEEKRTILDYWWAVLGVIVVAAGLGTYLIYNKKRKDQ